MPTDDRAAPAIDRVLRRSEGDERIDAAVRVLDRIAARLDRSSLGPFLRGEWLGHALHPALTDLPIGFWTSSWALDLVGGRRCRAASRRLIALGLLSVVPTAAAGAVDWSAMSDDRRKRVGAAHAMCNTSAGLLYLMSWRARGRGRHARGVALGMAGAAAASVGGLLGGHLAFATTTDPADAATDPEEPTTG